MDNGKGLFEPIIVGNDEIHNDVIEKKPGDVNLDELRSLDEKIIGLEKMEVEKNIQKELDKVNNYNTLIGKLSDRSNDNSN